MLNAIIDLSLRNRWLVLLAAGVLATRFENSPARAADDAAKAAPAIIRSAKSGPWSAAATWEGGKIPGPGARVQVRTGQGSASCRKKSPRL